MSHMNNFHHELYEMLAEQKMGCYCRFLWFSSLASYECYFEATILNDNHFDVQITVLSDRYAYMSFPGIPR